MDKKRLICALISLLFASHVISATAIGKYTFQNVDIYSTDYIIKRAKMLFHAIPDHDQVSTRSKPYMTEELYSTLKKAWDVPHWCYGYIGDEEFLYYFVTGNGGGSIGKDSIISGDVQSINNNICLVTIKYREYEDGYGYYSGIESIDLLLVVQDDDWVLADFGSGMLEVCKRYIKEQIDSYKSGNIVKEMTALDLSQSDINKACREFEAFLSVYDSGDNEEIVTLSYSDTSTPPTFKDKGIDFFVDWVCAHIKYPDYCIEANIEGNLNVRFIVDENGFVVDEEILTEVEPALDAEVLRLISISPQWKAGEYNNNIVRTIVQIIIPLRIAGK